MVSVDDLKRALAAAVGGLVAATVLPVGAASAAASEVGPEDGTQVGTGVVPSVSAASTTPDAGSAPVGTTSYPVPAGAVFAAPGGNDAASGTLASPVRTLARAIALVPAGGTVVLRAGTYHESVVIFKRVTVQSYPGEAVWLDGSVPVSGFVPDGDDWRLDGWSVRFDASPTYTRGAADSTAANWSFIDRVNYPMAAHPDQVWVGDRYLQQVASRDLVGPGTFYLDESTSQLYVGSDPAAGVRASDLTRALMVRAQGTVLRGFGVRRYAPSVWMMGAITVERPDVVVEDLVIEESATTGISVVSQSATLRRLTVSRSGMLGLHSRFAEGLLVSAVLSEDNNREHFNTAPVSGGMKIGTTRGIRVEGSVFRRNHGPGLWFDQSDYGMVVVGNEFSDNATHGLVLEISAGALVVDNLIRDNAGNGVKVNNTSDVRLWNNTVTGGGRPLNLVQDRRRNDDPDDGAVDDRRPWPDPTMPWLVRDVTVMNNVIALPSGSANCLLCVEDYSRVHTAEQMNVTANGNVYNRASSAAPSWAVVWSRGTASAAVHRSLEAFAAATGQESRGREFVGTAVADVRTGLLASAVRSELAASGVPLPADVASAAGLPTGSVGAGAFRLVGTGIVVVPPAPVVPPVVVPPVVVPPVVVPPVTPPVVGTPATPEAETSSGGGTETTSDGGVGTPAGVAGPQTPVGTDGFDRRVRRGWGTAEVGGSWSLSGPADRFDVAGGRARMRVDAGASLAAALTRVAATTSQVSVQVRLSGDVDGEAVHVVGRRVPGVGDYRARVVVSAAGRARVAIVRVLGRRSTVLASAAVPGRLRNGAYGVVVLVEPAGSGTRVAASVSRRGSSARRWTVRTEDATAALAAPGSVALVATRSQADRDTRLTVSFDDLDVRVPSTP